MPLAEKGVRGKGRQPLSPPQHTETPEREQRFSLNGGSIATSQRPNGPTEVPDRKRYGVSQGQPPTTRY